jgi:hypothetical protein
MAHVLVRHKVKDYLQWRTVFDAHQGARKAGTSKGGLVFRGADDPNEVFILWEVGDIRKAREFMKAPDLRNTMEKSGVTGEPDVYFLDDGEGFPA